MAIAEAHTDRALSVTTECLELQVAQRLSLDVVLSLRAVLDDPLVDNRLLVDDILQRREVGLHLLDVVGRVAWRSAPVRFLKLPVRCLILWRDALFPEIDDAGADDGVVQWNLSLVGFLAIGYAALLDMTN